MGKICWCLLIVLLSVIVNLDCQRDSIYSHLRDKQLDLPICESVFREVYSENTQPDGYDHPMGWKENGGGVPSSLFLCFLIVDAV